MSCFAAQAGADKFIAGTAIPNFGTIAKVASTLPIPKNKKFKIAFDMAYGILEYQSMLIMMPIRVSVGSPALRAGYALIDSLC